ncbi:phosphoenolpyruvate--protein phosphotransferase [Chloroflexia bacterium SDU3-3]|nr:phosphoenolpyruvate--protein phosphotransferase [Chloroflexia bacterium SDU3-3]
MQQLELVIHNATGLHARPARMFVDIAKRYQSSIQIQHGQKRVNAKSLIAVLTLGVAHGQHICIDISGEDEVVAAAALSAAVNEGLGEGPQHAPAAPAPAPAAPPAAAPSSANQLRGVAGAPGIAIGPVFRIERASLAVGEVFGGVEQECDKLNAALASARQQLFALREQVLLRGAAEEAAIFDVHSEILADADLLAAVRGAIADGVACAAAWQSAIAAQAKGLEALSNAVLAARAADLRDVGDRVLRLLIGADQPVPQLPDHPVIVVAYDLSPSETASLDPSRVLGFCTAVGGPNAHTAILARALGLPAVVSAGPAVLDVPIGTPVILDGGAGTLQLGPGEADLATARAAQREQQARRAAAAAAAQSAAITTDGHRVEVAANIGGIDEARQVRQSGAEGVGLLRTEFLFLDRSSAPTEEEQLSIYQQIGQELGDLPVIIRTLDIGGDKPLPYLALPAEQNPFLGERGIRLCLAHPDLLRQQLRAILRASASHRLRIMFPMIADMAELRAARALLDELRLELHVPPVEVGIMVEVPSAALMADLFAQDVDFFSIGTNDLTQYTLAMDRTHPNLATKADGLHPAVLRLIARTADAAHAAGKWVGVCGELAADPAAVPILVGLGVDELSISVPAIPSVKAQIRTLSLAECQERARGALVCATAKQVREGEIQR